MRWFAGDENLNGFVPGDSDKKIAPGFATGRMS
jgi:hypothetical protein